jgi:hypothetical protein
MCQSTDDNIARINVRDILPDVPCKAHEMPRYKIPGFSSLKTHNVVVAFDPNLTLIAAFKMGDGTTCEPCVRAAKKLMSPLIYSEKLPYDEEGEEEEEVTEDVPEEEPQQLTDNAGDGPGPSAAPVVVAKVPPVPIFLDAAKPRKTHQQRKKWARELKMWAEKYGDNGGYQKKERCTFEKCPVKKADKVREYVG